MSGHLAIKQKFADIARFVVTSMKNITIILPIHRIEESYRVMFDNAIKSVEQFHEDVKLMIVCPPSVKSELTNISEFGNKQANLFYS